MLIGRTQRNNLSQYQRTHCETLQSPETVGAQGAAGSIRERGRLRWRADQIQLCVGRSRKAVGLWHYVLILSQGLIKSSARGEQQEGVRLLSEIFRNSPERRRECLYYLALGNYKLGNFAEARRYNDLLLDHEPSNLQAGSLRGLIDDKVAKEGLLGVAILSGVAIAAAGVGAMILKGARRR